MDPEWRCSVVVFVAEFVERSRNGLVREQNGEKLLQSEHIEHLTTVIEVTTADIPRNI